MVACSAEILVDPTQGRSRAPAIGHPWRAGPIRYRSPVHVSPAVAAAPEVGHSITWNAMNTVGMHLSEQAGSEERAWDAVGGVGDEERAAVDREGGGTELSVRVQVMR
jgi:hypothetical protein